MTNSQKVIPIHIPQNIDLDELLDLNPLVKRVPNAKDYLLYILKIIRKFNNELDGYNPDSHYLFQQINSVKLQKTVQNYSILINWLVERGILECDNKYTKGKKCLGYRYSKEYHKPTKLAYITKRTLINKFGSNNPLITVNPNTYLYGYEPVWIKSTELAGLLKLKRNKMLQGLRKYGLLNDKDGQMHLHKSINSFFYIETAYKNGSGYPSVRINFDYLDEIRQLAIDNPIDFPSKT